LTGCGTASTTTPVSTSTPLLQPLLAVIRLPLLQQQLSLQTTPGGATNLNGAGATFPAPLYTKWFDEYNKATGVKINYQAVGSGAGIKQVTSGTVDFGASDGIMTAEQENAATAYGGNVLHIPMTSGAIAVIYNLQGVPSGQLKLTPEVLANIYLKKITKWNDPAITA
jgi:phosphate transport system substrate-binding protein